MTRFSCITSMFCLAAGASPQAMLQQLWASKDLSALEVRPSLPKTYKLRLCNAYAWSAPLEMRRLQEPQLVEYPLPYKECHDYTLPLSNGDELQFRAGDLNIGTFYVKGLPKSPAMLLLVPHRKDPGSMAVVFDSHMYTEGDYPQVAIVDAGNGLQQSQLYLNEKEHREALRFSSVVTLTPGKYEVHLANNVTGRSFHNSLTALAQERYVVIRIGNAANASDESFSEDLMVFPQASGAAVKYLGVVIATFIGQLLTR